MGLRPRQEDCTGAGGKCQERCAIFHNVSYAPMFGDGDLGGGNRRDGPGPIRLAMLQYRPLELVGLIGSQDDWLWFSWCFSRSTLEVEKTRVF